MMENEFTQMILDKYGHYPLTGRSSTGLHFRVDGHERAVLGNTRVHHVLNGTMTPIDANLQIGSNGEYGAPGLNPKILPDGEVQFFNNPFRHKTIGVGLISLNPFSVNILAQFPTGYRSGKKFIREIGVYSHVLTLHEGNKLIEELFIYEKPEILDGDYFVIASKIFDPGFPTDKLILTGEIYDNSLVFSNGMAYDAVGNTCPVVQRVKFHGNTNYLLSGIPTSWLDTAVYPVVIDPTWVYQPDATNGIDTYLNMQDPDNNYGTNDRFRVGEDIGSGNGLVMFNYAPLGVSPTVLSAVISLYLISSQHESDITVYCYEVFRDWVENQATWNIWKTSNSWATAGCRGSGTDRASSAEDSNYFPASAPTIGFYDWTISPTTIQDQVDGNNYGFHFDDDGAGNNDAKYWALSDYATAGNRPYITIDYISIRGSTILFFG